MSTAIQIIVIPLITGLLGALVFFFAANFLKDREKHTDTLLKLLGGIVTLVIALVGFHINSQQNLCLKQEKLATEVVELLPSITFAATNEIGLPKYCTNRSGDPMPVDDSAVFLARTKYGKDRDVLDFKIISLIKSDKAVLDSKVTWDNAITELEKECQADPKFSWETFHKKTSILNEARSVLIRQLGNFIANNCY